MLDMDTLNWEEPSAHRMKMERNLNFATLPNDEDDFGFSRKKTARDPMSHRIIEKRRRDRMNNCLADLSRLVPTNYLKKGRGRIEKTEIIEMAIKHLKHLQAHPCKDPGSCEVARTTDQDHRRPFRQGYQECMSEAMKFVMEVESGSWRVVEGGGLGMRLLNHLQKHYDKISGGGLCYTQALNMMASSEDSKSQVMMDVDNHSNHCFQHHASESNHSNQPNSNSNHFDSEHPSSKSQLREMLQNPGVPKQPPPATSPQRHSATSSPQPPHRDEFHRISEDSVTTSHQRHNVMSPQRHSATSPQPSPGNEFHRIIGDHSAPTSHQRHHSAVLPSSRDEFRRVDEEDSAMTSHQRHSATSSPQPPNGTSEFQDSCYKFKNNIKHRFNADLRHHHTSSPTDSHVSDRMSLTDTEDNKTEGASIAPPPNHPPALLQCSPNHTHAFSPYHQAPELTVKIPDRTGSDHHQHWDYSHAAETASSCSGSNPSPPPARGSSGSSSGYSTNGENNTKGGGLLKGGASPLSPYSPPPPPHCVPIFALHPKGAFYIPLTLESSLLAPYMVDVIDAPPVLHPISICVDLGAHSVKVEKLSHHQYGTSTAPPVVQSSSSFLMDKFHDRLVYTQDRYYPCPASPAKNGCV